MPDETVHPGTAKTLAQFAADHGQRDGGAAWQLESPRMLEITLANESVFTKVGAMIAYYGDLKFERRSSGGAGKFMKSVMTNESGRATEVTGSGTIYLADEAKEISVLHLADDTLYVNSSDLLAYGPTLDWDITTLKGGSMFAGGLFSFKLTGTGYAAITTHGNPLVLGVTPEYPLSTDPDATVAWTEGLDISVKADVNAKTLTGRGSGETWQMSFKGSGYVVVQPYEESSSSSGSRTQS